MSGLCFSRKGVPRIMSFPFSLVTNVLISHGCPSIIVSRLVTDLTVASDDVDPSAYLRIMGCSNGFSER